MSKVSPKFLFIVLHILFDFRRVSDVSTITLSNNPDEDNNNYFKPISNGRKLSNETSTSTKSSSSRAQSREQLNTLSRKNSRSHIQIYMYVTVESSSLLRVCIAQAKMVEPCLRVSLVCILFEVESDQVTLDLSSKSSEYS
jgi:hypothetical protein